MSLKSLPTISHLNVYEDGDGVWLSFEEFLQFLRDNIKKSDTATNLIRRDNLVRKFKKASEFRDGVGLECKKITVEAALKFIFNNSEALAICSIVAREVRNCILNPAAASVPPEVLSGVKTIKDLYDTIAASSLHDKKLDDFFSLHSTTDISELKTINTNYKECFSSLQWEKIALFEYHFHKENENCVTFEYEELCRKKWLYWETCQTFKGDYLAEMCTRSIRTENKRQSVGRVVHGLCFYGQNDRHFPEVIAQTVYCNVFAAIDENARVSSSDCCPSFGCGENRGIHVFVESQHLSPSTPTNEKNDIAEAIQITIQRSHSDVCHGVTMLQPGTLDQYSTGKQIEIYKLKDALYSGQLRAKIVYDKRMSNETGDTNDQERCKSCSQLEAEGASVHWKTLDTTKEWKYFVPLQFQLLLETFISKMSVEKTTDTDAFIRKKLRRMYLAFHGLLNVRDRSYCGVLKDVLTDQLTYGYHSASTVFSITSQAGLTRSMRDAERRLKREANETDCHFNTYLRRYDMQYCTAAGILRRQVSLRDCFLVLCLDNLVRLTFHTDPGRGDSRSSQICTIPVTLKGLPKDSEVVDSWHEDGCHGISTNCRCMQPTHLTTADVDMVLLRTSAEESTQVSNFATSMVFGLSAIWQEVNVEMGGIIQRAVDHDPSVIGVASTQRGELNDAVFDESLDSSFSETSDLLNISGIEEFRIEETKAEQEIAVLNQSLKELLVSDDAHSTNHDLTEAASSQNKVPNDTVTLFNSGFRIYHPPPLLTRHPPPYIGKDDDISKLREIISDVIKKSGKDVTFLRDKSRILCAPDHKIANNLFRLMEEDARFKIILPEFPVLHLRKSKIVNLFGAYKEAGLETLARFLQDSEEADFYRVVRPENIDSCTRLVRRLATAIHIAFIVKFLESLLPENAKELCSDMGQSQIQERWKAQYEEFVDRRKDENATFALHVDILNHCEEVLAIALAERIGGQQGYQLLLAVVKRSLPFSFLNGASAYAGFCVQLLIEHYSAGTFHRRMKETLFSTPYRSSSMRNFGLDSQREMDHRAALKGFRPRGTVPSILPRMSLVDKFEELEEMRTNSESTAEDTSLSDFDVTFKLTDTDLQYIIPTAKMIIKTVNLSADADPQTPFNAYAQNPVPLPLAALDRNTQEAGEYLIWRFLVARKMLGATEADCPSINSVRAPKELLAKLKSTKSVTIKRMTCRTTALSSTPEKREKKRQLTVKKETKSIQCFSSERNTCQAILRPDCSKSDTNKAVGIKNALLSVLAEEGGHNLVSLNAKMLPSEMANRISIAIVDFSGVKFKTFAGSGVAYLKHVEQNIFSKIFRIYKTLRRVIVTEEKYSFTPDDLKAATRQRRQREMKSTIAHLKDPSEMIDSSTFDRTAVTSTSSGKQAISTYLAANIGQVDIRKDVIIDIDSEYHTADACGTKFAVPLRSIFSADGYQSSILLQSVQQRKGEAEMAQLDWLVDVLPDLRPGESIISLVTSADIDAVPIHLFVVSNRWPRKSDGSFIHPVHVVLQKTKGLYDTYNMTGIVETLEKKYGKDAGMKVAITLCMGGNDFLPKFFNISHAKLLQTVLSQGYYHTLFPFVADGEKGYYTGGSIDKERYLELMKTLYCPPRCNPSQLSVESVRQYSIKDPKKSTFNNEQLWMPPVPVLHLIADLIDLQIAYLFTAGEHASSLPDFLSSGCLVKRADGQVDYNFDSEMRVEDKQDLLQIPEAVLQGLILRASRQGSKRRMQDTPQKGERRKIKPVTSTPKKQ